MTEPSRDVILDHYRRPRNRGSLLPPALVAHASNPLCGDEVVLYVKLSVDASRVEEIRFDGRGCSYVLSSASMLTEFANGESVADIEAGVADLVRSMRMPGLPSGAPERDLDTLQQVKLYPSRIKRALLPWTTLEALLTSAGQSEAHRS